MTSSGSRSLEATCRARPPGSQQAPATALEPAIRSVIERAAALPRGLALLHRAPLEPVAAQLATHAVWVARARAALESAETRPAVLEHFARAMRQGSRAPASAQPAPRLRSPEELLHAAEDRSTGVAVLASASPEYAAIAFGVHPDLVLAARQLIARRGVPITLAEDA